MAGPAVRPTGSAVRPKSKAQQMGTLMRPPKKAAPSPKKGAR